MTEQQIIREIEDRFPCFGGGKGSSWKPVAEALKVYPLQFAAGVDVGEIVRFVIGLLNSKKD